MSSTIGIKDLLAVLIVVSCIAHSFVPDISIYHLIVIHPLLIIFSLLFAIEWN